ncbi:CCR4-NOT transcription complex subunit 7 isoform X2 [Anarrhichthys ocellatus]|uniref:CCR4-NOT transcription complex subunit 7 isoform X2 n=1 Tax=Anarrhichthys ocellatus TaxID=433405 RepID=UPI0012EE28F1|nr:CCR4-NOT transcription complex subunit 7 isoform X2 [Anarrhichthys ocellatus]
MPAATVDHNQKICEVWANNLEEELKRIRHVIRKYNYIAMDTEFPGVVARPIGEFRSNADYQYQLLRCNVDLLKIIQLGLTFMNEQGEYPPGTSTWQFNFKFNLTEDMYAQDSIELLTTSGIQFKKHEDEGIETLYFAELLMTSGVVLCDGVRWLSFHSIYRNYKLCDSGTTPLTFTLCTSVNKQALMGPRALIRNTLFIPASFYCLAHRHSMLLLHVWNILSRLHADILLCL